MPRYATLAQLKNHLRITNTDDDADLTVALDAAEEQIDGWCDRTFDVVDPAVDPTSTRMYDSFGAARIAIDDAVDVSAVATRALPSGSWDTVSADLWELLPHTAAAKSRPHTILRAYVRLAGVVRVTGWFGWPAIPDVVVEASILQAARLYSRRGATLGVHTTVATDGTGMRLLSKLDPDVQQMLTGVCRITVL